MGLIGLIGHFDRCDRPASIGLIGLIGHFDRFDRSL